MVVIDRVVWSKTVIRCAVPHMEVEMLAEVNNDMGLVSTTRATHCQRQPPVHAGPTGNSSHPELHHNRGVLLKTNLS